VPSCLTHFLYRDQAVQSNGVSQQALVEIQLALDGSCAVGAFVALRRIEQNILHDVFEFVFELLDGDLGTGLLNLCVQVVQQGDAQHTVKGMHADLAVGPVIHRTPVEPSRHL